jgi:GLPGLI family protein
MGIFPLGTRRKRMCEIIYKKAIGKFRGREYTAWFAEEMPPIASGPWKLFGLPGLILKI